MSGELVSVAIPAVLLAFYPLVLALAWWPLLRRRPRLLKYLHLAGWGLTLMQAVVFIGWHLSLRGQWPDAVPFGLAWLAAGAYFWLRRRQLGWPARLYFGGWFCYPAMLALAYLADKIFFVLVSVPVLAFLPTTTYYGNATLTLREPVSGFLAARKVQLLEPVDGILERHEGFTDGDRFAWGRDSILSAQRLPGSPFDSITVLVHTRKGQRVIRFSRRD